MRVSPTKEAIIRLHVIEKSNIILKLRKDEVTVPDLRSAINKIILERTVVERGGKVISEERDISFLFLFCVR